MYFEQNAQAMLAANPANASTLRHLEGVFPITDFELLPCPDGAYTLKYKGMCLHDAQSPLAEAEEVISQSATLMPDRVHVLFGLGLGYLLDALSGKSPGQIVIYEPDRALLRFILENVDLSEVLGLSRVALFCDQQEFMTYLRKKLYSQYKLDILILRGSAYLMAGEVEPLMEQVTRIEQFRILDFKTGQHFHELWISQFFENSPHFPGMETLEVVAERFPGRPALVISRGPSLDAALPHIKSLEKSAVLIAVGSALHRLHEADITPDFALFYDANGMREQVHGLPEAYLSQITFVASPFTQPAVFGMPSRGKLLMLAQNNTQLVDYLDQALDHKHLRLGGGGTVSIIAFQLAQAMRCDPIILTGQDLAFPNNQVYAGGIEMRLNEKGQLDLAASERLYAAPYDMTTVSGQHGQELPTLQSYKSFLLHLEEMAVENAKAEKPLTLWNASLGGAHIEGFPVRELGSFIDEFAEWKPERALPEAPHVNEEQEKQRREALCRSATALAAEIQGHVAFLRELGLKASRNQGDLRKLADEMLKANQSIYARFSEAPFASYLLIHEIRQFRERFQETLPLPDGPIRAQKEIRTFVNQAIALFQGKIMESIQGAIARFESGSPEPLPEIRATAEPERSQVS